MQLCSHIKSFSDGCSQNNITYSDGEVCKTLVFEVIYSEIIIAQANCKWTNLLLLNVENGSKLAQTFDIVTQQWRTRPKIVIACTAVFAMNMCT